LITNDLLSSVSPVYIIFQPKSLTRDVRELMLRYTYVAVITTIE
jgi:hypothetical protein